MKIMVSELKQLINHQVTQQLNELATVTHGNERQEVENSNIQGLHDLWVMADAVKRACTELAVEPDSEEVKRELPNLIKSLNAYAKTVYKQL